MNIRGMFALGVTMAIMGFASAQSPNINRPSTDPTTPVRLTGEATGKIESISTGAGEIEIKNNQGILQTYKVNDAPILTKGGDVIDMSQLRTGDSVTLQLGPENHVMQVSVAK